VKEALATVSPGGWVTPIDRAPGTDAREAGGMS
jgi:hypothetical protein